jgi:hypothetical protein
MGTSNANEGQNGRTPLVPTWLPNGAPPAPPLPPSPPPDRAPNESVPAPAAPSEQAPALPSMPAKPTPVFPPVPVPPALPPIPQFGDANRFATPRKNFTRFASSGGSDRVSLGRALAGYVSNSSGGSRTAARRMGSSRTAGAQLLGFLSSAIANGAKQALRSLNLQNLVGLPIEEVFLGLMDFVCPFDGGTVDEGIARDAFVETIADLAENGIVDLDGLNVQQMQTIFELYASHAIENRICNDIGAQVVTIPADAAEAASVQRQLLEFIRRSVADSLTHARAAMEALTPANIGSLVTRIYEQAFGILQSLAEAEADKQ